jgi:hypothetical protein
MSREGSYPSKRCPRQSSGSRSGTTLDSLAGLLLTRISTMRIWTRARDCRRAAPDRCRFCASLYRSWALFSFCERCSLDSCTGFEVLVPGRQSMAPAMNPACRSANLIRRTVSHLFCRQHLRFSHVLHPNHSMKPTAPPRNKFSVFATLAVAYLFLVRFLPHTACSQRK